MKNEQLDLFISKIIAKARKQTQEEKYDRVFFDLADIMNLIIQTTNTEFALKDLREYVHVRLHENGFYSAEQIFLDLKLAIDENYDNYEFESAAELANSSVTFASMLDNYEIEPEQYAEYYFSRDFEFLELSQAAKIFAEHK